jgi:anti-anti-sigma factor
MANPDFKITSEHIQYKERHVTVFHMRGWLDAQSEAGLFDAAQEAHTQGVRYLVLNFEDVQMLTSNGIRALYKIYKLYLSPETSGLKICSAPPQVYHALAVTGYLQTVPMYENLQAALISYDK